MFGCAGVLVAVSVLPTEQQTNGLIDQQTTSDVYKLPIFSLENFQAGQ